MTEKTTENMSDTTDPTLNPTGEAATLSSGLPNLPPLDPPAAPAEGDLAAKPKGPSFAELGVRPEVLRAIEEMGFTEPMMVQAKTLPLITEGRDLMVQSRTGSGKTAAFGIPFVSGIVNADEKFVQALVLLPTRELALQVAAELAKIAAHSRMVVVPVYGGAPMGRQVEMLSAGGQIVCGTPGRVLDHLRRGTLRLDRVKCAVLDECDEMLSMGFQEDIEAILEKTPESRQTLLFSATVPEGIQRLSRRFLKNPEFLKLSADFVGVHEIKHLYYSIPGVNRENELLRILAFEDPKSAIIFCNTREETSRVAEFLRQNGHDAEAISSDLSQSDRERVMARMRAGGIKFLVATDVAARGIDIENLSYVFNYTFPEAPEIYIHRTGRTGRAGKQGTAVSLIGPTEVGSFYYLKLLYKIRPDERSLPSEVEIRSRREGERVLALRSALTDDPGNEWKGLARRLMSAIDGERLVAALLAKSFSKEEGMPAAPKPAPAPVASAPRAKDSEAREPDRERATFGGGSSSTSSSTPRSAGGRGRGGFDRTGRPERGDRPDRGPRPERSERGDRPDRGPRPERSEHRRPERGARSEGAAASPRSSGAPAAEREFWEVWSEERSSVSAPSDDTPSGEPGEPGATGAPGPAPETGVARGFSRPGASAGFGPRATSGGGRDDTFGGRENASTGDGPGTNGGSGDGDSARGGASDSPGGGAAFARLYLNLGRKDGANEAQILDLIATHAGPTALEGMDIMNTHTYLNVSPGDADRLCAGLTGKAVAGRDMVCERAKPRRG